MSDHTALCRNIRGQRVGNDFDNVIAGIVAVNIIKGLEVIKIEVAETERYFVGQ
jgi:hypothetical protein